MPETTDPAASALDEIRQLEHAATRGPWETEEGDNHWQLFGAVTPHMHPLQLIKAPKHGTPYAEYWPNEADSAFIAASRTAVPRLLKAVEAALKAADEAIPALGVAPADCTDACDSGACDCSGESRPVAWNLDPAKLREAITAALTENDSAPAGAVKEDEEL